MWAFRRTPYSLDMCCIFPYRTKMNTVCIFSHNCRKLSTAQMSVQLTDMTNDHKTRLIVETPPVTLKNWPMIATLIISLGENKRTLSDKPRNCIYNWVLWLPIKHIQMNIESYYIPGTHSAHLWQQTVVFNCFSRLFRHTYLLPDSVTLRC